MFDAGYPALWIEMPRVSSHFSELVGFLNGHQAREDHPWRTAWRALAMRALSAGVCAMLRGAERAAQRHDRLPAGNPARCRWSALPGGGQWQRRTPGLAVSSAVRAPPPARSASSTCPALRAPTHALPNGPRPRPAPPVAPPALQAVGQRLRRPCRCEVAPGALFGRLEAPPRRPRAQRHAHNGQRFLAARSICPMARGPGPQRAPCRGRFMPLVKGSGASAAARWRAESFSKSLVVPKGRGCEGPAQPPPPLRRAKK